MYSVSRKCGPLIRAARTVRRAATTTAELSAHRFDLANIRSELAREHEASTCNPSSYEDALAPWHWLDREMSSNVAGETGAVCIYDGAAAALRIRRGAAAAAYGYAPNASPSEQVMNFVEEHRAAEQSHLDLFEALLPPHKQTCLLPAWRCAGFALGFAPALVSDRTLYLTVQAVETFVEEHYHEQIAPLREHGRCPQLLALLEHCCADEVHHKDDAQARVQGGATRIERAWMAVVRLGSAVAAEVARRW